MTRPRVFISHSFQHGDRLLALKGLLERRGFSFYDHSVPAWAPIPMVGEQLRAALTERIARCSTLLLLAGRGVHRSPTIRHEIEAARILGKRIVVVMPHGEARDPIPELANDYLYKKVGWDSAAISKALKGECLQDTTIYRTSEDQDFEQLVARIAGGTGMFTLFALASAPAWIPRLQSALRNRGILLEVEDVRPDTALVPASLLGAALGAAAFAGFSRLVGWSSTTTGAFALLGAGLGVGVVFTRKFRLRVRNCGTLHRLQLEAVAS